MVDSKTQGFISSLGAGFVVLAVCLVVFEILRRTLPAIYYYRNSAAHQAELADYDGNALGTAPIPGAFWPAFVIPYSLERLIESHGLDTALFLRYLRSQAMTFGVVAVFVAFTLMPVYATGPNRYLPVGNDERTTGIQIISLSNIPPESSRLWGLFVIDVLVITFICFIQSREIAYYTEVRRRYRGKTTPANFTVALLDLPEHLRDGAALNDFFEKLFPGEVEATYIVRDAKTLDSLNKKYVAAYTNHEALLSEDSPFGAPGESSSALADAEGPTVEPGIAGTKDEGKIAELSKVEQMAFEEALAAREDLDVSAPRTASAFVVFRRKRTALVVTMTNIVRNGMKVLPAPEPRDVFWQRLHITRRTANVRRLISFVLVILMIVLWAFPVAFVQSLSNISELAKQDAFSFLADLEESAPGFVSFLESFLPPALLLLLNILVPVFMRLILVRGRSLSRSDLDSLVARYMYIFHAIVTFSTNVLIGSVLGAINTIVKDGSLSTIVNLLSNTVPAQAAFFLSYLALNFGIGAGVTLLSLGKLLLRPFFMMGVRTERQRRKANAPLSAMPTFKFYSITGLHVLIGTVYCTVAPLSACVVAVGIAINYVVMKHVYMYADRPEYHGGGKIHRVAWEHSFFSIFLHQIILIGLFGLKKNPTLAALEAVLLVLSFAFFAYLKARFYTFSSHGDLVNIVDQDEKDGLTDQIPEHYAKLYKHPALDDLDILIRMENVQESQFIAP